MTDKTPGSPQQAGAEIVRRCGNCHWLVPITGWLGGHCRVPLPCWVMDELADRDDDMMRDNQGAGCETWRKRGAE